jgi:flagellar motor switch protein FliM
MRPERQITAERALARHSGELLAEAIAPGDLLPLLGALGATFARQFGRAVAPLLGGNLPNVKCGELRQCTMAELGEDIAPLAANSLLAAGSRDATLLLSIEARAVLQLIDRTFGGRGRVPAQLPAQFPVSGDLLAAKLEAMAGQALAAALGGALAVEGLRRDGSIAKLRPYASEAQLAVMDFDICEEDMEPWRASLAFPLETLSALFGKDGAPAAPKRPALPVEARPLAAPFDDIPLALRAVLVDMNIPVSRLSALAPGQLIPVAVARSVPLRAGDETFAHGTIGTMDDRIAVRVTQAFQQQEPNR